MEHGHPSSVDDLAEHARFVGYTRGERPATRLAFVYADRHLGPPVRAFVDYMLDHADELFPQPDEPAVP